MRDFVLCGLPLRRTNVREYVRQNGRRTLTITAGSEKHGLPFGVDRLIPIWLSTAWHAVGQPLDGVFSFRSAGDILRAFNPERSLSGQDIRDLRARIERIFFATFFIEEKYADRRGVHRESYRLIQEMDLWFDHKHPNQHTLFQNEIKLDPRFVQDLSLDGAVPFNLQAIRQLSNNPGALDLYQWEAWRSWTLIARKQREIPVPLFGEVGLFAQLGCSIAKATKMRQTFKGWHSMVKASWPQCPNELAGDTLIVRPGRALPENTPIELPSVRRGRAAGRDLANGERLRLMADPSQSELPGVVDAKKKGGGGNDGGAAPAQSSA